MVLQRRANYQAIDQGHPHTTMSAKPPSRVIFIGNIPFELSEEQLIDIFKEVGPIVNFRLMFDKETGKPRGFAFCEYGDVETAGSAIRNLSGFDVGGRHLKVDYADNEMPPMPANPNLHISNNSAMSSNPSRQQQPVPVPHNQVFANSVDEINATLGAMSNQQLVDLIGQAKALAIANPEQARTMLQANPQMTFALFQAMLMTNLVEPRVVQQVMHSLPNQESKEDRSKRSSAKPPQQQQQPAVNQEQVIKQILGLSEDQINALPADQQSQIRAFRAQYGR